MSLWTSRHLDAVAVIVGPRDIPHTFIVSSEMARFLLVTEPGDFAGFVRALAELVPGPNSGPVLPPRATWR